MLNSVGIDPLHIDTVRAIVGMPGPQGVPVGIVLDLNQDYSVGDLKPELLASTQPEVVDGVSVYRVAGDTGAVIHQKDARTFIVSMGGMLSPMLNADNGKGQLPTLASKLKQQSGLTLLAVIGPVRPIITGTLRQNANDLPPPLRDLTEVPELIDALLINVESSDVTYKCLIARVSLPTND
jgi:hypothetical protein